ncbi:putative DNA-binding protein [Salipaludibacillus daqingensis]|uniref:putative DNA-binding protein n=1 Tax=Salipaludibacillus daqingensis TaxID=3041001 RepID=UPI002472F9D6|nr:putative DNA-binding protein [Salipaludibacillus daqingensis]
MIEKTIRMNYLYDFYQSLLTTKQNQYMSMYYLDDWSLGEIAENFDVSRQAVYDNIKRTEALLEEYEQKLQLLTRYEERRKLLTTLKSMAQENESPDRFIQIVKSLEKLE